MQKKYSSYDLRNALRNLNQKLQKSIDELEKDISENSAFQDETLKNQARNIYPEVFKNVEKSLSNISVKELAQRVFKNENATKYLNKISTHLEEGANFIKTHNQQLSLDKINMTKRYHNQSIAKKQLDTQLGSLKKSLEPVLQEFNKRQQDLDNIMARQGLNFNKNLFTTYQKFLLAEPRLSLSPEKLLAVNGLRKIYHLTFSNKASNNKKFLSSLQTIIKNPETNPALLNEIDFLKLYTKTKNSKVLPIFELYQITEAAKNKLEEKIEIVEDKIQSYSIRLNRFSQNIQNIDADLNNNKMNSFSYDELSPEEKIKKVLQTILLSDLASLSQAPQTIDFLLQISTAPQPQKILTTFVAKQVALCDIAEKLEQENISKIQFLNSTKLFRKNLEKNLTQLDRLLGDTLVNFDYELIANQVDSIEHSINTSIGISQKKIDAVLNEYAKIYLNNFEWAPENESLSQPLCYKDLVGQIKRQLRAKPENSSNYQEMDNTHSGQTSITSSATALISTFILFDMVSSALNTDVEATNIAGLFDFQPIEASLNEANTQVLQMNTNISQVAEAQIYSANHPTNDTSSNSNPEVDPPSISSCRSSCSSGAPSLWD